MRLRNRFGGFPEFSILFEVFLIVLRRLRLSLKSNCVAEAKSNRTRSVILIRLVFTISLICIETAWCSSNTVRKHLFAVHLVIMTDVDRTVPVLCLLFFVTHDVCR